MESLAEAETASTRLEPPGVNHPEEEHSAGLGFTPAGLDPTWDLPYGSATTSDGTPWISSQEVVHEISQVINQLPANASLSTVLSRDQRPELLTVDLGQICQDAAGPGPGI